MLGERLEGRKGPKARIGLMMDRLCVDPTRLVQCNGKEFISNASEAATGKFKGEQVGKTKDMNWKRNSISGPLLLYQGRIWLNYVARVRVLEGRGKRVVRHELDFR